MEFKEKLIEVYADLEYTSDEFEKILRWIKNNFEKTYNIIGDLYKKEFEYQPSIKVQETNEIFLDISSDDVQYNFVEYSARRNQNTL